MSATFCIGRGCLRCLLVGVWLVSACAVAEAEPSIPAVTASSLDEAPAEAEAEPEPEGAPEAVAEPATGAELEEPVEVETEAELEPHPFAEDQLERILAVQEIVAEAARTHGVDPALINALIWVESKFQPRARGPAGAQGLMQLMPKTAGAMAKRLDRKRKSYDPDFNIHAGTLLLSRLLDRFDGDVTLALAGYNRGGGTVSGWVAAGEPLPEGTQRFVERVLEAQSWFERPLPSPSAPTDPDPDPDPDEAESK